MMLAEIYTNEIADLIEQVKAEDARYTSEMRAIEREKIMIPVVLSGDNDEVIHGFSRNISTDGICLVTTEPILEGTTSPMLLSRSDGHINEVSATCKWSKAFGAAHCISGWQFDDVVRDTWS